ncbi:heterokaryon incompatibility protein-domain-containing protein [Diaporthe sp. PMI_573]|nr:heterokaryon incompatibility protein-domain-containing protein [Diaporthaceae sp. PMI_573]
MWLINVRTRQLEEFFGLDVPRYAILSHTWATGEEVTFQEMRHPEAAAPASLLKAGWMKIDHTCQQAAQDGLEYAWVDTCCIDKSSSAELSEAINSMFRWYERAALCYVFLQDLTEFSWGEDKDVRGLELSVKHCRWFTRSWTLQELIAPLHMKFFDRDWRFCFTKAVASVALSKITGIDFGVLSHHIDLSAVSVAQKMSWAGTRQATRKEDVAYSLLGIFGINMPMLYGEEERAFLRLQAEIISTCPDTTIFAWSLPRDDGEGALQDPRKQYPGAAMFTSGGELVGQVSLRLFSV